MVDNSLDINEILRIMPHRYPFVLIDRIVEVVPGEKVIAIKNLTINEAFFQGHFPNQPIMPGVLILEAMCQAGCFILMHTVEDPLKINMFLSSVESMRFRSTMVPGDQIRLEVDLLKLRLKVCKFHGRAFVADKLAAEAVFMATIVDRAGA